MPRYVARPVVVEAHCWEGNVGPLPDDFRMAMEFTPDGRAVVKTADGTSVARRGDWIVRGGEGTFAVVKAAAFETAFEPAQEQPAKRPYHRKDQHYAQA